jgi:hypothetical protein
VFDVANHSFSISDTHTFSPTLINELTFGTTLGFRDGNNGVRAPKLTGPGDQSYTITPGGSGRLQGNSGRGIFRGPFQHRGDFALKKRIPLRLLGEASNLEFRSEFFQIFNNPTFASPNSFASPATFGRITGTFGTARQIQFALKVSF